VDDIVIQQLFRFAEAASVRVACDLPSGVESDSGELLNDVPDFDLTVTFGALKPAHRLMPAMQRCGRVVLADIGIAADTQWNEIGRQSLPPLDPAGHKYDRGMVHCVAGDMPGAIALAATAAARAGAGYVRIEANRPVANVPAAVVQGQQGELDDPRIGALLIGPGLGLGGYQALERALASGRPLVIDGDALSLLAGRSGELRGLDAILTPHEGEFRRLFPALDGSKAERAAAAARQSGSVIVYKGPDTLIAAPDGRLGFAPPSPAWLATAGTGDVLAGIAAAMVARGPAGLRSRLCGSVDTRTRCRSRRAPHDRRRSRRFNSRRSRPHVNELIVRIAARGDGVTASGRHVPFSVPGDAVLDDGALAFGPIIRSRRAGISRVRRVPAPARRRRCLSRLSLLADRNCARAAWTLDRKFGSRICRRPTAGAARP
jgi:ADP-dependent NAD(P)H-hydrate dehydratase / NAD(P)H-hydrate epimerase